jgi:preprotein translocase subunit SecE
VAKIASDKSNKASGKLQGVLRGAPARPSAPARQSSGGPKGVVSTKPAGRMRNFLREVKIEMSKVTWPPRRELLTATAVVIIAIVIAGIYIGVFDFIWTTVVHAVGLG